MKDQTDTFDSPVVSGAPGPDTPARPATGEWAALLSGTNGVRSLVLAGGVALHAINVYLATTILPSVVRSIGGLDLYAWNTTIFVVASIIGSAFSAKLLRLAGPRGAYAVAATIFALGAMGCAAAPSMPVMLVGRLIQGCGGGLLFALAYAMIRIAFDETLWPRGMALVSGMWGIATLIGPAIGGVFAEMDAWRAAFWVLVPVSILFVILAMTVLPGRDGKPSEPVEVPAVQLSLLVMAVLAISVGSTSSNPVQNLLGVVAASCLVALLVRAERRSKRKLFPSETLNPGSSIAALYLTISLLAVTVTSSEVFVPLFLQVLHHQSPLLAGYLAALMAAGWTLGSVFGSGATDRGARRSILLGPALQLVGMVILCMLMPNASAGTWRDLAPLCPLLIVIGFGVGLAWPHLLTAILKAAPPHEQELAGASITTIQLFATATGAALAGLVVNAGGLVDPGGAVGAPHAARWLFGVFALAPLLCLFSAGRVVHSRSV